MLSFGDRPVTCYDIDDTIIPWAPNSQAEDRVTVECMGRSSQMQVMTRHVENLKRHWKRGHVIVVWSAGGGEWAKAVVEALGLTSQVDVVMAKPSWYYDDKPCEDWMGRRIFLYKNEPQKNEA